MKKDDHCKEADHYYVPEESAWPIKTSLGLVLVFFGIASILQNHVYGHYIFGLGALLLAWTMFGWFSEVVKESTTGLHNKQMDRSYRWGMIWFIFSEVMFFGAFFAVLFYASQLVVPWLSSGETQQQLWPNFQHQWPLLQNPDPKLFQGPDHAMGWWPLPFINTSILLMSGVTITWAHWGLLKENRKQLIVGLSLTVLLGIAFIICQAYEYHEAYEHLKLTMASGIYGSTFYMLTGFHGAHVTIGTIMLFIILLRSIKGHFKPNHHFAFEAVAWYWHFVDFVWLALFVFVYLIPTGPWAS